MNRNQGAQPPFSQKLFDNLKKEKKTVDENKTTSVLDVVDRIFDRIEQICSLMCNEYLNEEEAARFLRLTDPKNKGRLTIRNYALRSKKLSFAKIGRTGLLFKKKDLEKLFDLLKAENSTNF